MKELTMKREELHERLYQALETELRAIVVYTTAIRLARDPALRTEWERSLDRTNRHAAVTTAVLEFFGLDPGTQTLGTKVIHQIGSALIQAMRQGRQSGDPEMAELVAAECVALANAKCQLNWRLISELAEKVKGIEGKALKAAHEHVEPHREEHRYPTTSWTRALWRSCLGFPPVPRRVEKKNLVPTSERMARAS